MDVAHSRSLGFVGKELLFRKIEFERYRKPHVVEYPRSAIVLNPQHTRQLKDSIQQQQHDHHHGSGQESDEDEANGERTRDTSDSSDSDDGDDPLRIDKSTQLCSDEHLRGCLHLRWKHITPVGLGLVNLGNTCFANCVLQALAHVPALAQYFMATFRSADNQLGAPFDFAFALAETFRKMHHAAEPRRGGGTNSVTGAYRPGMIMGNLRLLSKHFSIGRQSDAHEFAVQLLFACQKSLLHRLVGSKKVQPRVAQTTALYRICGGYLLSQVTWSRQEEIQQLLRAGKQQAAIDLKMEAKQARHQESSQRHKARHGLDIQTLYSNTYDPFTILSVELAGHTLQHCLDKFCQAEELDGRCYHSPREVGVRAKKKFSIHIPPPVLVIHLKRFGPTGNKINKHVQFPLELNITRYCTPLSSSSAKQQQQQQQQQQQLSSSHSSSSATMESRGDCQYELNAICVHEGGSLNYGHYYTMAKASNGMWYEFNDAHVSRLSEEQLQRAQAYMLCYSRVPTKKTTTKPVAAEQRPFAVNLKASPTGATNLVNGRPSDILGNTVQPPPVQAESDAAIGKELSEAEVQALLEKRRRAVQTAANVASAEVTAATQQTQRHDPSNSDSGDERVENEAPQPSASSRKHNLKRMRDDLPIDSDSDDGEDRDGAYVRRLRPPPGQRPSGSLRRNDAADSNNNNNDDNSSVRERDTETAMAADETPPVVPSAASAKSSMYGGLIKSMKRTTHGSEATNSNGHDNSTRNSGDVAAHPHFRVGRHAVSALHARKVQSMPDTVKRPATAPKFQQRIRDPMWEMEMDRGKVKKVRSKEKAPDPFEGTNPFQEVSRGMFDVRGRRRRD